MGCGKYEERIREGGKYLVREEMKIGKGGKCDAGEKPLAEGWTLDRGKGRDIFRERLNFDCRATFFNSRVSFSRDGGHLEALSFFLFHQLNHVKTVCTSR